MLTKSCPRWRGKWHEVPKGERLKETKSFELFPPQLRLRSAALPHAVAPFWCCPNSAYSAVPLRGAIVSMGLRGVQGGLRGEIEIFPGPPAKKVIKMLICYLFVSPPQSIAKPSPGWNKVALLTAVRNSPCSCPFSVSLHPPLAALNSEPRPGRLLALFSFYFIIIGLSVRLSM